MTPPRTYSVYVRAIYLFRNYVEVEASTEDEARNRALEDFETDWSDADQLDIETTILPTEEKP